ncbi:unnamed protein product [Chironomus riparius]|uniref:N-acetyltransferase domain-containing protein n=1 Tax=Chironomus riparius TaxID=315576 RepID=A0A9N9S5B0_9DIPT|nr:unnamed protein product [Chironomus riparius]
MTESKKSETQNSPKTYKKFKAKDINSENLIEYAIRDLQPSQYDAAIKIIYDTIRDEPLSVSRRIFDYEQTIKAKKIVWRNMLNKGLSIGCFTESGELIGLNVLSIADKNEEIKIETTDKNIIDSFKLMIYTNNEADIFGKYNIDKYLTSMGLCVNPDYRLRGIATELLKVRPQIMKNLDLTVSVTTFTSLGSQTAAKNAGFEDVYVIRYDQLSKVSPNLDFVNGISDYYKIMALRI